MSLLPAVRGISLIKVTRSPSKVVITWLDAAGEEHLREYFGDSAARVLEALRSGDALGQEVRHGILIGLVLGTILERRGG